MFFLARFINVHNENTQDFWVEICQQILTGEQLLSRLQCVVHADTIHVGLFSLTSIGLIPFRVVDTYRMSPRLIGCRSS